MNLPQDFTRLMTEQYGHDTASALQHTLCNTPPEVSVRLNPHKFPACGEHELKSRLSASPVPWCPGGYYLPQRPPFTMDPLLHAGAYYVQEASSMYIDNIMRTHLPHVATGTPCHGLDLCAAPGGKSTLLMGMLPAGSTLICNEPVARRAQVLAENMDKWTRTVQGEYPVRCIVTQQFPEAFSHSKEMFDFIVVDAPCSGEGMFRKDEEAARQWSMEGVLACQARQRDILETIYPCLRSDGLLVYSTCTFNHYEDEDNTRWILSHLGTSLLEERHFLPGRDHGEGFYVAAFRKTSAPSGYDGFAAHLPAAIYDSRHDGSVADSVHDLTYDEALHYLRGEALHIACERGMTLLTYKGLPLGMGKSVGTRINNLYPTAWRIRTTHLTPFSLIED